MRLSYGVYACIEWKDDQGRYNYYYTNETDDIYSFIEKYTGEHYIAEDASSWAEINGYVGAEYEGEGFIVYIMEDEE